MLASLFHLVGLTAALPPALFSFPSPPGWDQYVHLIMVILDFLAKGLHSAGIAVIVFTLLIKIALMPLTVKSLHSSKSMQELQPKIKELQKKYGKDRQRLSAETMRLYSEHHVNPMAGCLPMVVQLPIFWGLYRAIEHLSRGTTAISASHYWTQPFLWIPTLQHADPYHVLPILAGVFQFVQTKMARPAGLGKATDSQQAMMNQMMNFMPLMVVLFGWKFSSGPVIYWVTQSAFSVVQQWFITGWGSLRDWIPGLPELPEHKRLGYRPPKPAEDVVVVSGEEAASAQPKGVMAWFQTKMMEAQQAQHRVTEEHEEERERKTERESATARPVTTTAKNPNSYQAKVDAAARAATGGVLAEQPEPEPPPRGSGRQGPPARSTAGAAAGGNGRAAPANGAGRPPVVPRKSRPNRKKT
ncbi:MAG TPA: YidC/Oxa1 family membrane protein insertase, partial [Dehalococcoidia bacterium]|nr:YidC/Oxa1 family membrane protein insertase [Dehalococcoidia bacterium]